MDKNDLLFIKGFSKIKVSKACKKYNVNQSNLVKGRCGRENEKLVRAELEKELATLRIEESDFLCQEK